MAEPTHTPDVNTDGTVGTVTRRNPPAETRPDAPNISTEHHEKGDAVELSDTLDRPASDVHPAKDFDPAADAGRPAPGADR